MHDIITQKIEFEMLNLDSNYRNNCQLQAIVKVLNNNYNNNQFDVNDLCRSLNSSRSSIYDYFITFFETPPSIIIENIRLGSALQLFPNLNLTISRISKSVGYFYQRTFRHAFNKRLKIHPQNCRDIIMKSENISLEVEKYRKRLWVPNNDINWIDG